MPGLLYQGRPRLIPIDGSNFISYWSDGIHNFDSDDHGLTDRIMDATSGNPKAIGWIYNIADKVLYKIELLGGLKFTDLDDSEKWKTCIFG